MQPKAARKTAMLPSILSPYNLEWEVGGQSALPKANTSKSS